MLLLSVTSALIFFGLTSADPFSGYCPRRCKCDNRTVRCIRSQINFIPRIPTVTTVIDFRSNNLKIVEAFAFEGLISLDVLILSDNGIEFLHDDAFNGLVNLRQLYLSNNKIKTISATVFRSLNRLKGLYLEKNFITEIDAGAFQTLNQLNQLFLHRNVINTISKGIFSNINSLRQITLYDNPIDCNCIFFTFWKEFVHNTKYSSTEISLACETPPELYGRNFTSLQENNFHCSKPEIATVSDDMKIRVGESIEMPCLVTGEPKPEIIWMLNTNKISADSSSSSSRIEILPTGNLKISSFQQEDIGIYECIGSNIIGETKSHPIKVSSSDADRQILYFTQTPTNTIAALDAESNVVLNCAAGGSPPPNIQWFFNNHSIIHSTRNIQIHSNGSLVIHQPTFSNEGNYTCEARNDFKSIQAHATLQIKELPQIILSPKSQKVLTGQSVVLECDADGYPAPEIYWKFNGDALTKNERIVLENENTELIINQALEEDSGTYTCIAENKNGFNNISVEIRVTKNIAAPKLLFEPFDMEVFVGTTIEIPCRAEGADLKILWRKDGRHIVESDRHHISQEGNLYVKNSTLRDTGRYECTVKNNYGRVSAAGLVTIRSNNQLAPGDKYVRTAFAEATREIDISINNTIDTLFSNHSSTQSHPNYGNLFRVFRFPTGEARQLARAAEIFEQTLVNIRKHIRKGENISVDSAQYEFRDMLSQEHLRLIAELSGCMGHRQTPNCTDMCFHSKYRSIDATCNNLQQPTWGASLTAFRRIEKPIYENGINTPIGWNKNQLYSGYPKPSARLLSTSLIATEEITPDDAITHMVMQWGQFLDHDLDHAIPSVSSESWDGVDCKKTCNFSAPCFPIEVPPDDPRIQNRRCIDVVRSSAICGSGMTSVFFEALQPREQINQLTSFVDASQVYGYSYQFANDLRNLTTDEGLLRTGVHFPNQKDMLPFAAPQDGMDCRRNLEENNMNCFTAGDIRVNEQVGLLAMHTIWMRQHNLIARKFHEINPHWDGDTLYQEARKIVGAQMQHITYKHWLPLILGSSGMALLGPYQGYDSKINPTIANEFATAALRFGHTLINPILHRLNASFQPIEHGHLPLHKAFFAPWRIAYEGGVDPLLRGLFNAPAKLKKSDQNLNTELTEKLFHTSHAVSLDLAAINIQRGRDHGIPGYNVYRQFCNLTKLTSFDDLHMEISDPTIRRKLKELYGHPDNIDLWVGGVLEDQIDDAKVGPTFQCLLVEQFRRLRDGDRFYYENPSVFTSEQLQQIQESNLGRIICDTGDNIDKVTDNVFLLPTKQGGYKSCEDIPGPNLYFWQDCGSCHSPPDLLKQYTPQMYTKKRNKRSTENATLVDPFVEFGGYEVVLNTLKQIERELESIEEKLDKMEASIAYNGTLTIS